MPLGKIRLASGKKFVKLQPSMNERKSKKKVSVSSVKRLLNSGRELKRFDQNLIPGDATTATGLTTTTGLDNITPANAVFLSGVDVGSNHYNREGNSISPKKLMVRFLLEANGTSQNACHFRVIIYSLKNVQNNPTPVDFIQNSNAGAGLGFWSNLNENQIKSIKIYHDRFYTLRNNGDTRSLIKTVYLKNLPKKLTYTGNTSIPASAGPGGIYMIIVADRTFANSAGPSQDPKHAISSCMWFYDS